MNELWWQWLDMAPIEWLMVALVLALGTFVQRATGFGLAVVGAPLLLLIDPRLVPVTLVVMGFSLSLLVLRRFYRQVQLGEIGMALVGRIPGNLLGLWLLVSAPLAVLKWLIAGIVLFAVLVRLFQFRVPVNRRSMFLAGVVSGVFGTASAIGGPPMALLMHDMPPDRIRSNLAAFFLITSSMTLVTLAVAGYVSLWHLGISASFLPAMLLGQTVAARVAGRIDQKVLQWSSLVLCSFAAIGLVI